MLSALLFSNIFQLLAFAFWLWMMYDCLTSPSGDRTAWILLMIFIAPLGAPLYFIAKKLPQTNAPQIGYLNRITRRTELRQAEAEAKTIGKAYQYIKLGWLLHEMRSLEKARAAFATAVEKEPDNAEALWGAATIAREFKQLESARDTLKHLLEIEPEFRRGDASLTYAKTLFELEEWDTAREQLEKDIKRWGNAESYLMMAQILEREENYELAKSFLETMLARSQGTYEFQYKKNRPFIKQAERMLKRVERAIVS
ncbi:MAG: tetratricopeptide repeat protein [Cyanobacteria bacterium J06639_1]